jgi:hypothetical protein
MACPLFIPTLPLGELVAVAAPLGDLYRGHCSADPVAEIEPETLRRYCNFGYARGFCPQASGSEADAVRLLVKGERGSLVEIAWAVERDHHPVAVGVMEVETGCAGVGAGDALALQAFACASAYVRQVHRRPGFVGQITTSAHQ